MPEFFFQPPQSLHLIPGNAAPIPMSPAEDDRPITAAYNPAQSSPSLSQNSSVPPQGAVSTSPLPPSPHQSAFDTISNAFWGQESNYGKNSKTSSTGARGPMQIEPDTWKQYAQPGENIDNPKDNRNVGNRILSDYYNRYNGDPSRMAVAYFSGPGNVAQAGSTTPWIKDRSQPGGKTVSSYVGDIIGRINTQSNSSMPNRSSTRLRDVGSAPSTTGG